MNSSAFIPASLAEALDILSRSAAVPIAGGTDLMVRHRRHGPLPVELGAPPIFIGALPELRELTVVGAELSIGAAVRLADLASHPDVPSGLKLSIGEFASPAIRNSGTIGGNICNASPAADTLPFLYANDAAVVVASAAGERTLALCEFITGPGKTALKTGELLVRIVVPVTHRGFVYYRKVAPRRSNALSKLSIYAEAESTSAGGSSKASDFRLTLGAVAPTVVRAPEAESLVAGKSADELRSSATELANAYRKSITPIDDQRSTAAYRRNTTLALIHHLFSEQLPSYLEKP